MSFRLSTISPRDSRKAGCREAKRKLYLATEGLTELHYFESFNTKYSSTLLIEIHSLERLDSSKSNPKTITQMLHNLDFCSKTLTEDEKEQIQTIIKDMNGNDETSFDSHKQAIEAILGEARFNLFYSEKARDLASYQLLLDMSYIEEGDSIGIIIDRDKHSFTEEQFDYVESVCKSNNYLLGITNPCFELYLLLHLKDVCTLNLNEIKDNKKTGDDTYMTSCLKSSLQGSTCENKNYEKSNYDSQFLVGLYSEAKNNFEKSNLKSDIRELKDNVGTSIFSILDTFCP